MKNWRQITAYFRAGKPQTQASAACQNDSRRNTGRLIHCLYMPCCLALLMAVATAASAQEQPARQDIYLDAMHLINSGQMHEASEALIQMIKQEPEHAGAWLDLAILQCELGYAEEAERLFALIMERFDPPPGIIEVIAQWRAQGCAGAMSGRRATLMLGRGIDSNVNQGASSPYFTLNTENYRIDLQLQPEYLPKRDGFTMLSAEYARDLATADTTGFVQFQARQNDAISQYNTALVAAGAEHMRYAGGWQIHMGGSLAVLSMDGRLYQRRSQLQAVASPPLPLPENMQFSLLTGLSHIAYPTLDDFGAKTHEIRGMLNYRTSQTQVQASLGYSCDRALADRPGGDRRGWLIGVHAQKRIAGRIMGELGWSRQAWHSELPYSPGLIDQRRSQATDTLSGALTIPIAAHQAVRIEWRELRNKENIPIFQYNNQLLMVNWQWGF